MHRFVLILLTTALVVIALKKWVGRKELEQAEAPFEAVPA